MAKDKKGEGFHCSAGLIRYFDAEEKVAGVLKTYRFDSNAQKSVLEGEYLLKPEELAQYCLGIGELHLYSLDEARKKEEVPVALGSFAAG